MVRASFAPVLVLSLALGACGAEPTPPGTLNIALDSVPAVVINPAITVAGTVIRSPEAMDIPIVASVAVGTMSLEDTVDASGRFSFPVSLPTHVETDLTVTASDATGSTVTPVTVSVLHDQTPPSVSSATPANLTDNSSATAVSLLFSEPVVDGSLTLIVSHQRMAVAGATAWSADRREVTFTPGAPFPPNAVITVLAQGARDAAGNVASAHPVCFVTAGGSPFVDPRDDIWVTQNPGPGPDLVPVDLTEVRFATGTTTLYGTLRFASPRVMSAAANNNVFAAIDLDVDRDGGTGFTSLKDTVFGGLLPAGMAGADYGIALFPQESLADSSYVIQYAEPLVGPTTFAFFPGECGLVIGFAVPRAAVGGLSGEFGAVLFTETVDLNGAYADPAPDASQYIATVTAAPPAGAAARGPAQGHTIRLDDLLRRRGILLRW